MKSPDPAPVHVIAARWGFARATDFARAFRAAYGMPPTVVGAHRIPYRAPMPAITSASPSSNCSS